MDDHQSQPSFWTKLPRPFVGLAPMDGITDAPFRQITARYGRPDLMMTEFVSVEALCRGIPNALLDLTFDEIERPIVAQIYGAEPEDFFHAAQIVGALKFDGLDINMGCPAKGVAGRGCGAALINDPGRAVAILRAARQGLDVWAEGEALSDVAASILPLSVGFTPRRSLPLSVKTRIGYDHVQIRKWMNILLSERPAAITLHGRTLKQGYGGAACWETIAEAAEIARGTGTLIVGNGDVASHEDALNRVRETGVDGVLIGRAALGRPWIFNPAFCTDTQQTLQIALEHARLFEVLRGMRRFAGMRKHLGWYCRGFSGASALRAQMVRATHAREVECLLAPLQWAEVMTSSQALVQQGHPEALAAEYRLSHIMTDVQKIGLSDTLFVEG